MAQDSTSRSSGIDLARVAIRRLDEVLHLRDDIVRHHLAEWPNSQGCLDPGIWGHLGDPAIRAESNSIPLTMVALTPDGRYVGKGSIIARDLDHPDYRDRGPWMGGLCVLEEDRGRGVGKRLHAARLRAAAAMGIERLFLFTEKRPYPTVELYERFGWAVERVIPDFDDGSTVETRWVMSIDPRVAILDWIPGEVESHG